MSKVQDRAQRDGRRPLRLAILGCRGIPARYGGFETFAEEIATRLAARGVEVTVFCDAATRASGESFRGVRLRYAWAPPIGGLETLVYDLLSLWRTRRGYDVVYMLGYTSSVLCWVSRLWGNEVWINMDGLEWKRSKWPWYGRLFLRAMEAGARRVASLWIADSQAVLDYLRRRYRTLPACRVLPYGCDLPTLGAAPRRLAELGLRPDDYFLIVARLEPENHVAEMIAGYRRSRRGEPLVIVGNDRSGTAYVRRLAGLAGDDVRFLGGIYDRDLLTEIRSHARVYLHGHSVGGTNPSLLESMACACPALAHDNPFNRETAGDAALYFAGEEDLAEGLQALAASEDLRRELGARGRQRVRDHYRWDEVADRYEELLAGRSAASAP